MNGRVFMEDEKESSFTDTLWGIAKWVGIAIGVVLTGGFICHVNGTASRWMDDNFSGAGGKLTSIFRRNVVEPYNHVLGEFNKPKGPDVLETDKVFGIEIPRPTSLLSIDPNAGGIRIGELSNFSGKMREQKMAEFGTTENTTKNKIDDAINNANKIAELLEVWNEEVETKYKFARTSLSLKSPKITIPTFKLYTPDISNNSELNNLALDLKIDDWSTLNDRQKLTKLYVKMSEQENRIIKERHPFPRSDKDDAVNVKTKFTDYPIYHGDVSRSVYLGIGPIENMWERTLEPWDNFNPEREVKVSIKNKIDSHDPEQLREAYDQTNKAIHYFQSLYKSSEGEPVKQGRFTDAANTLKEIMEYITILQKKPEVEKMLGQMYDGIEKAADSAPNILKKYVSDIDAQKEKEQQLAQNNQPVQVADKGNPNAGLPNNSQGVAQQVN